jgi:hypothetical protein
MMAPQLPTVIYLPLCPICNTLTQTWANYTAVSAPSPIHNGLHNCTHQPFLHMVKIQGFASHGHPHHASLRTTGASGDIEETSIAKLQRFGSNSKVSKPQNHLPYGTVLTRDTH